MVEPESRLRRRVLRILRSLVFRAFSEKFDSRPRRGGICVDIRRKFLKTRGGDCEPVLSWRDIGKARRTGFVSLSGQAAQRDFCAGHSFARGGVNGYEQYRWRLPRGRGCDEKEPRPKYSSHHSFSI